jgi:Tfp pilus assembly protein PilF
MNRRNILIILLVVVTAAGAFYGYRELSYRAEMERLAQEAELRKRKEQEARALVDKLIAEAKASLDAWPAQRDALARAAEILDRALKARPSMVQASQARVQLARLHIKAGYISSRNFAPGSLDRADRELKLALAADPKSAEAYVLQGHIFFLVYRSKDALQSLEKAKAIGTDNPFLYLNWVDALIDLKRWDEADVQLRNLLARYGETGNVPGWIRSTVHGHRGAIYQAQGKLDEADREYQAALVLEPNDAWRRGNYGYFLLFNRGMPDAAIVEMEKALAVMNYGLGRLTLAAARYAKWAEEKNRSPTKAAEYLALAKADTPDYGWIMSQAARWVSAGPAIQNMVKELMKLGVPLDTRDNYGDSGLTLAAHDGNLRSVLLLIGYGANVEVAHLSGQTAVSQAASQGHPGVVKALVARGAKVNSRDRDGRTPLYFAAQNGNKEMVNTLVSFKANVNIGMTNGYTPLMSASFRGDEDMVRFLLDLGADPALRTADTQQNAADFAKSRGHEALASLLHELSEKRRTKASTQP